MQQVTDLRRQTAATALAPLSISTWWERVWAGQLDWTGKEVAYDRRKYDTRYLFPIQDLNAGSPTFGQLSQTFLDENGLLDPFNSGPL